MIVSRIGQRRQITIPKKIFSDLGLSEGDFIEVSPFNGGILIKRKKIIDTTQAEGQAALPPAPSYTERMRLMELLKGNRRDDSEDIPLEKILDSRVSKANTILFDE